MRPSKKFPFVLALILVLINSSCAHGGEGEGGINPPATPENNWDEMNWDEGEWE